MNVTNLQISIKFEEANSQAEADINIMWAEGEHGDQYKVSIILQHYITSLYVTDCEKEIWHEKSKDESLKGHI